MNEALQLSLEPYPGVCQRVASEFEIQGADDMPGAAARPETAALRIRADNSILPLVPSRRRSQHTYRPQDTSPTNGYISAE